MVAGTGFDTQGLECLNGMVRVGMIVEDPDANTLQELDDNKFYAAAVLLNDAVNLAANLTALPFAARDLWAVISRQRSFIERGLLKGMNRAERMQIISDIFVEASRTPEGKVSLIEAAREAQVGPQSIQRAAGLSVQHADKMIRIVSDGTIRRLNNSALMVAGSTVGPVISGTPARFTGSASGSVNWIVNVVGID